MRNEWWVVFVCAVATMLLVGGCTTQSVTIQNVSVQSMMPDVPVHLGEQQDPGTVRLSAGASDYPLTAFGGRIETHTTVNAKGEFQLDTTYNNGAPAYHPDKNDTYGFYGSNFHAAFPQYSLAADLDLAISKHASLVGGIQYSTLNNTQYNAEYLGIGLTSADSVSAIRADFGWRLTSTKFSLDYAIITTPFQIVPDPTQLTVELHSVTTQSQDFNFYCSLELNSNIPRSAFDFFLRGGLVRQTEFNYPYRGNTAYSLGYTASLISFTPGLVFNLSPTTRLLAGVVLAHDTNSDDATPLRPMPMGQFEFRF